MGASFAATATHLTVAGLARGVLAAIPGAIDYVYTVPPASFGEARAIRHALANFSVDYRYAQAGKWQELERAAPGRTVVVGHVDDLKENQMKLLRVNGQRIVLARTTEGYQARADRCSHRGGPAREGIRSTR